MERIVVGTCKTLGQTYGEMGKFRYEVFVKELGWSLPDANHEAHVEFDEFDTADVLYVVALSFDDCVVGCARLIPTSRPHLLRSIFPHLVAPHQQPNAFDVWELSRLAVLRVGQSAAQTKLARTIFLQAVDVAALHGATSIIGVVTLSMERFYRQNGIYLRRIGRTERIDGSIVTVCAIDVAALSRIDADAVVAS